MKEFKINSAMTNKFIICRNCQKEYRHYFKCKNNDEATPLGLAPFVWSYLITCPYCNIIEELRLKNDLNDELYVKYKND